MLLTHLQLDSPLSYFSVNGVRKGKTWSRLSPEKQDVPTKHSILLSFLKINLTDFKTVE